ncbi:MAG: ABC transporter permease [Acidimicrobiales bacterium]
MSASSQERVRRSSVVASVVLGAAVAVAVLGPWLAPHDPGRTLGRPYDVDGVGWLGTEVLGRDVWSRLLHGGRPLVVVPILITVASTLVGTAIGVTMAASRSAGRVLRTIDLFAVIPPLVVLLVLLYRFGASALVIGLSVIVSSAPFVARYMRAAATPVLDSGWVQQARLLGDTRRVIMWRDVVPNIAGPMLADSALRLGGTFAVVAAASFLGFGPSRSADWAVMVDENLSGIELNALAVAAPAIAIASLTVPLNILGDRLAAKLARP